MERVGRVQSGIPGSPRTGALRGISRDDGAPSFERCCDATGEPCLERDERDVVPDVLSVVPRHALPAQLIVEPAADGRPPIPEVGGAGLCKKCLSDYSYRHLAIGASASGGPSMLLRARAAVVLAIAVLGVGGLQDTASAESGNAAPRRDPICVDVGPPPFTHTICTPT